jgi:antitoxin component HigA of HigAB toxin-antitoxin module
VKKTMLIRKRQAISTKTRTRVFGTKRRKTPEPYSKRNKKQMRAILRDLAREGIISTEPKPLEIIRLANTPKGERAKRKFVQTLATKWLIEVGIQNEKAKSQILEQTQRYLSAEKAENEKEMTKCLRNLALVFARTKFKNITNEEAQGGVALMYYLRDVRVSKDSALNRLAVQAATDLMQKRTRSAKWSRTN